jgi:hypothetical protein
MNKICFFFRYELSMASMTGDVTSNIGDTVLVSNDTALVLANHASCSAGLCFAPQLCSLHLNLDVQADDLCPFL